MSRNVYQINFPKPPKVGRAKSTDRYRFEISLDPYTDADIIKVLESKTNKSEYIRQLVRKDAK